MIDRQHFGITGDLVAFYDKEILLVDRGNPPYGLSFPGGYLEGRERTRETVVREAFEEVGLVIDPRALTLVPGEWDHPDRNLDRPRNFTWAYTIRYTERPKVTAGDDAKAALWVPYADILDGTTRMVFPDHPEIIEAALAVHD